MLYLLKSLQTSTEREKLTLMDKKMIINPQKQKILLGVTGATGMLFLSSFLDSLAGLDVTVHGVCSASGRDVLKMEQGLSPEKLPVVSRWFDHEDLSAPPASGSSDYSSMVVLPCTNIAM